MFNLRLNVTQMYFENDPTVMYDDQVIDKKFGNDLLRDHFSDF